MTVAADGTTSAADGTRSGGSPVRLVLRPGVRAPQVARRTLRAACVDLSPRLVDDAALIVGELVTQSIRQARSLVEVVVETGPEGVTIRVADKARTQPLSPHAPRDVVRSWNVVRRLSAASGCRCHVAGREMWAQLRPRPRRAGVNRRAEPGPPTA